jgi:hypothetical protein
MVAVVGASAAAAACCRGVEAAAGGGGRGGGALAVLYVVPSYEAPPLVVSRPLANTRTPATALPAVPHHHHRGAGLPAYVVGCSIVLKNGYQASTPAVGTVPIPSKHPPTLWKNHTTSKIPRS